MFDFEEGESQYKQTFATDSLECADIYLFAPTLRAKTLVRAHFILNVFVRAVLKVSERAGVKARLKRLRKTRVAK
jgi:CelD/BcsL family acetyltransferase involved in cellulose biosynthesis